MPTTVDTIIGKPAPLLLTPNSNQQQDLRNNYAMDFLAFRVTGTVVLASFTANPTKTVESLENFFQTLSLTATGTTTDQLCNVDGPFLRLKTRLYEGTDVTRFDVGTSNGTYVVETNLKRYFCDPRSNASTLTRLYTDTLSSLSLAIQTRDGSAMLQGGTGGTVTLSGFNISTSCRQYLGIANRPNPQPYVKETQRTFNITASANDFVCERVPKSNLLRRQFFKGMVGSNNYSDPSDTIFGATGKPEGPHVKLKINNAALPLDQVYQALRADNKLLFGVETIPTGWAVYEPARNRKLVNSLAMTNVADAVNQIDVNYTAGSVNTIQITDEELVKVSNAQYTAAR